MHKFDTFLKRILTVIFKESPFDKQKAEEGLKKIKKATNLEVNK